jgi:hypothetical protein
MKTLKESLLDDIETTMNNGSKWAKEIEQENKAFLKAISTIKNYESSYSLKDGRVNQVFVPNALKQLGYDANHIEIMMYTMDNFGFETHMNEWKLSIILSKRSDDSMKHINTVYDKMVYMDRWEFYKWNDVVKELIKPAAKSLDTFKKFLDNMEKWNEQLVGKQLLLK